MSLKKLINRLLALEKEYNSTRDSGKKRQFKTEAASIYFRIEEELAKIRYSFRLIDIRNFHEIDKNELVLFPDVIYDIRSISDSKESTFTPAGNYPVPLLFHLYHNHNKKLSAMMTSAVFMDSVKEYLLPGDFQHLKSGALRFIANTRFAAAKLRECGILRNSATDKYKYWEITIFGILIAQYIIQNEAVEKKISNFTPSGSFLRDILMKFAEEIETTPGLENLIHKSLLTEEAKETVASQSEKFTKLIQELGNFSRSGVKTIDKRFTERFIDFLLPIDMKLNEILITEGEFLEPLTNEHYSIIIESLFPNIQTR